MIHSHAVMVQVQERVASEYGAAARAMYSDYVSLLALEARLGIPASDRDGGLLTDILCRTQERAAWLACLERVCRSYRPRTSS